MNEGISLTRPSPSKLALESLPLGVRKRMRMGEGTPPQRLRPAPSPMGRGLG